MYELGVFAAIVYACLELYLTIRVYLFLKHNSEHETLDIGLGSLILDRIMSCIILNVILCIPLVYIITTLI